MGLVCRMISRAPKVESRVATYDKLKASRPMSDIPWSPASCFPIDFFSMTLVTFAFALHMAVEFLVSWMKVSSFKLLSTNWAYGRLVVDRTVWIHDGRAFQPF